MNYTAILGQFRGFSPKNLLKIYKLWGLLHKLGPVQSSFLFTQMKNIIVSDDVMRFQKPITA